MFLMAGTMKIVMPKSELEPNMAWVEDFTSAQVKAIGTIEVIGAIGTIIPAATNILPILSVAAPTGLAITMFGAAITHFIRGELSLVGVNFILFAISVFVAFGRYKYFNKN